MSNDSLSMPTEDGGVPIVRWIGQKHRFGCMAAVAAMILGVDYEEACGIICIDPDMLHEQGNSYFVLDSQLADRGYAIGRKYQVVQPGNRKREVWPCEPWADLHWCEVHTSADNSFAHAVVMLADGTILDPMTPERKRLSDYPLVNFIAAVRSLNQDHPHAR